MTLAPDQAHALLAPSGASWWSRCAGALAACKGIPDETNEAAASGTVSHEIAKRCLVNGTNAQAYCGATFTQEGFTFKIDQERADRIQVYLDAVRRRSGKLFVEVRLDTSRILGVPGQGGTGDAVIADLDRHTIEVRDFKDGYILVRAPGNEQLIIYLAAALDTLDMVGDWKAGLVAIHQPKRDHYDEYTYTIEEVEREMARIRVAAQLAYKLYHEGTLEEIERNLTPGEEQCTYCPIRGSCKKRAQYMLDQFEVEIEGTEHLLMTDAELAAAHLRVNEISGWCKDIQREAVKRALGGHVIPGHKTVMGREGPRQWKDEDKAENALALILDAEQIYKPRNVISPTEAEKRLKKAGYGYGTISALVTRSPAGLSLVPISDNRPAVTIDKLEFDLEVENTDLL
jgi:hypothetical protein